MTKEPTRPDSARMTKQITDGKCSFCGGSVDFHNLTDREKMIAYVATMKASEYGKWISPEAFGWLISVVRNKYCMSLSIDSCKQILHEVSGFKEDVEKQLRVMKASKFEFENLEKLRQEFCGKTGNVFMADNKECTCKCHAEGKKSCINCSFDEEFGVWHIGLEEKLHLMEYSLSHNL